MSEPAAQGRTKVEKVSDREVVATRLFDSPLDLVFDAWSKAELFKLWWAPKSMGMTLASCEMDVRTGGGYRLVFDFEGQTMVFFGRYIEVKPRALMVWTNEESGENSSITTVTFEEKDGGTLVVLKESFPSKAAFDANHGSEDGLPEQFEQLDELLLSSRQNPGT